MLAAVPGMCFLCKHFILGISSTATLIFCPAVRLCPDSFPASHLPPLTEFVWVTDSLCGPGAEELWLSASDCMEMRTLTLGSLALFPTAKLFSPAHPTVTSNHADLIVVVRTQKAVLLCARLVTWGKALSSYSQHYSCPALPFYGSNKHKGWRCDFYVINRDL